MKEQDQNLQAYLNRIQSNLSDESDFENVFNIFYENKNYQKILNFSNDAIKKFPNNPIFYYWNATASLKLGNLEDSFSSINTGLGISQNHLKSILLAIDVCNKLNEMDSLVEFIRIGVENFPQSQELIKKSQDFFLFNLEYLKKYYLVALKIYENGGEELGQKLIHILYENKVKSETAIRLYIEFYELMEGDKDFLNFLLNIVHEKNIKDENLLLALIDIINKYKLYKPTIISYLADYFASKEKWSDKLQLLYENSVELRVATYSVYKLLANKYMMLQQKDKDAIKIIFSYFLLEADNKDSIEYLLPFILKKNKFTEEEKNFLKIAYKFFPDNKDIFKVLIDFNLFTTEESIDNLEQLENYFEQNPNNENIIKLLGYTYLQLNREDSESLFLYEKLIKYDPNNKQLITILTDYYLKESRRGKLAIIIYEKAFQMGAKRPAMLKILADYYISRKIINNENIAIFALIFDEIKGETDILNNFVKLFINGLLQNKITIKKEISFLKIIRTALEVSKDTRLEIPFLNLAYVFKDISNRSFEIYKNLYNKYPTKKELLELLYLSYIKRNIVDDIGVAIFKHYYSSLKGKIKKQITILLYQYFIDKGERDEFAQKIINSGSDIFTTKEYNKNIDIQKQTKMFIKQNKKDKDALGIYANYLQIDEGNLTVLKIFVETLIKENIYPIEYLELLQTAKKNYPNWEELSNYFALFLAKNKIRDSRSYEIWEQALLKGYLADEIMFELLSYYINNQIVNEKSEIVIKYSISKGYKNKEILMLYVRCLERTGNFPVLIPTIKQLLEFDITEKNEIEFIAKTLLFYAEFKLLSKFLDQYEDNAMILYYKIKNYYYFEKLHSHIDLLTKMEKIELKKNMADIYEIFADYYFYEENNEEKGIWGYEQYLSNFPNDGLVLYKIAFLYYGKKEYQKALKYLKKLILFNENDIEALKLISTIHMEFGMYLEALKIFRKIIKNGYKDNNILRNYAISLFKTSNFFAAIDVFREYLKENPDDKAILLNLAYTYIQIDFKEEAIETLNKIIEIDNTHKEALYSLFTIYLEDNRTDEEAEKLYETLIDIDSNNIDALKILALIYSRKGRSDDKAMHIYVKSYQNGSNSPEIVRLLSNRFLEMTDFGDIEFTIKVLSKAVEYFPSKEKYWNLLLTLLVEHARTSEYKQIFEEAFEKKIKPILCAKQLAIINFDNNNYDNAILYCNNVLMGDPYDSQIYYVMANIHFIKENYKEAKEKIEAAITYSPDNFNNYFLYAQIMEKIGNIPLALYNLEKTLEINGYHLPSAINYARIAYENKVNLKRSIEFLKKIRDIYPNSWEIPYYMGMIFTEEKDLELAEVFAKESLDIEENEDNGLLMANIIEANNEKSAIKFLQMLVPHVQSNKIYNKLGELYLKLKNVDKARENFAHAAQIDPNSIETKIFMGRLVYTHDKDIEAAHVEFENILAFNPNNKTAKLFLARIYFEKNNYEESLKYYTGLNNYLEESDFNNLLKIYKTKGDKENILQTALKILQVDEVNANALLELFKIYKSLNNFDKAIETFESLSAVDNDMAKKNLNYYFELLLDAGKFKKLKEEIENITKDPKYDEYYWESYFFMKYFLFKSPYKELQPLLEKLIKKSEKSIVNFKENKSLIFLSILLQENDLENLRKNIHLFNKKDEIIKFLTGVFFYKKKQPDQAAFNLKNFTSYWGKPYFESFLEYTKEIIPLMKHEAIYTDLINILNYKFVQDNIDIYGKIYLNNAERKFEETFIKGKDIKKGFKNLISRLERYKLASGTEYEYLNQENTIKFYQRYLFIKKDYKECMANAKKYQQEGSLFNLAFFKELKKKKVSKKNLLKILGTSLTLNEIPVLFDFLDANNILNLAKIKILEEKQENINENILEILWKIFDKKEISLDEIGEKFKNSKSYLSRFYLYTGNFEAAYDIVMDMNYFEFMSLKNKSYILEILRKNHNYDQLLTYAGKIYDKAFIDDEVRFYYVIALNNFTLNEKGNVLLTKIDFSHIKFLNSASEACNENQYPHEQQIESFLKTNPPSWQVYELFNFLKDFSADLVEKYSEILEELMDEKDLGYIKGRILLVKAKFNEVKKILNDSPYPEDWETLISISMNSGKEIARLIERLSEYYEKEKIKMDNLKTFLPFSYKSIFNYHFFEKYLGYKERYYEQLKNMNELDQQVIIAQEIIELAPTKKGYYNELFYLYRDFKKDYNSALNIIDRLIYFNEKENKYIIEKSKLLSQIGNLDEALSVLLKIEDRTKEVSEEIAGIYEKKQLYFDAITIYDKLFVETEDIKYLEKIIQFYFSLELYNKILSLNKKYPNLHSELIYYYQGLVYFKMGEYENSIKMFDEIDASTFEKNDEIIIYKGLNYFNLGKFADANKYLKRALQRKVKEEVAWTKLAEILYNNGKLDNAYQAIEKAINKGNKEADAYLLASEIYLAKDMKRDFVKKMKELRKMNLPETSDAHFRYGDLLLKMGKNDKAEVELKRALHLNENNMKALNALIEIYLKEENYTQTLPLLLKAYKTEPEKISLNYARVLYILKKYTEAKGVLQYVKENTPETWLLKGKIYFELKSNSEALGKFQKVLESNPDNVEANIFIGKIYYEKFKLKEALKILLKAENLVEDDAEIFKYLGLTYNKIGETINAIIYLKKSILKSSHDHETILELGKLYYNKNRYNEALKEFAKVIKIKYDLPEVHLLIAKAYRHLEKYELSLKAINRSLEFMPDDPIFLEEKINILEIMNRYQEIVPILEKIEAESGLSLKLQLLKARTLRMNGRLNLAFSVIEQIKAPETISFEVNREKAFILYQKQEYDTALPILKSLYEKVKKDDELFTILAFTLIELKKFKTLQSYLRNYRGELLKTEYIPYLLGYIEYEENSDEYAMNYFYQAIAINRSFVPAYRKLGEIYFKKQNYIMSVDILKSALQYEKSKKMDICYYLALSYMGLGKYFEALRYIKESLNWNYLNSAEEMISIYEKLKLYAFGVIITRKLLLNKQIDKFNAWRMLILFLFNLNRKSDAVIEGFYNYNNIKNVEDNIFPFAKELLYTYDKPFAAYNILNPIINENSSIRLISLYIVSMGSINMVNNKDILSEIDKFETKFKDTEEYDIFESLGIFWYKHGNLLKAKLYFENALKINPQLEDSVYYLSLMK